MTTSQLSLLDLMKPTNLTKDYGELLTIAKQSVITVTCAQIEAVESKTRGQSQSRIWYQMRSGRITASNFKSACHTDEATPSNSLITTICHPELVKFTSVATSWGLNHEKTARDLYQSLFTTVHEDFKVWPYITVITHMCRWKKTVLYILMRITPSLLPLQME
jgi:hypothetical protein